MSTLYEASLDGDTKRVKQLLDEASRNGDTKLVKELLDKANKGGYTALQLASMRGHTEVVKLLLDRGASVDEKGEDGDTALMRASYGGHTEVVKLLLDRGASVDEKDTDGNTALMLASQNSHTEVVKLLLDRGASLTEKNNDGDTALVAVNDKNGNTAILALVEFDEDQLGRMAAAQVHRHLLNGQGSDSTATAVLKLVRAAGLARARARKLRLSDPRSADEHQVLFARLQLAAAACIQNDELGEDSQGYLVQGLFDSDDGRKALEHAVEIEAKELLAQPVVQGYIKAAWRGELMEDITEGYKWAFLFVFLLPELLFLLPLVVLVPALEPWLVDKLDDAYLLRLPVIKFGLECAADLALALTLTLIPATDLATAPVAPLLLVWVGSGLLWEGRQLTASSSDSESWLTRIYNRLAAYWADHINRLDAMHGADLLACGAHRVRVHWRQRGRDGDVFARGGRLPSLASRHPCAARFAQVRPVRADVLPHAFWRRALLSGVAALLARRLRRQLDRAPRARVLTHRRVC